MGVKAAQQAKQRYIQSPSSRQAGECLSYCPVSTFAARVTIGTPGSTTPHLAINVLVGLLLAHHHLLWLNLFTVSFLTVEHKIRTTAIDGLLATSAFRSLMVSSNTDCIHCEQRHRANRASRARPSHP
jgi:hypothetical protein